MRAVVGAEDVAAATTMVAAEQEREWSGTVWRGALVSGGIRLVVIR